MENKYNLNGTEKQIAYATDLIDNVFNQFSEIINQKRENLEIHRSREASPKNDRIISHIVSIIELNEKCENIFRNILESDPEAKHAGVVIEHLKGGSYANKLMTYVSNNYSPEAINLLLTPEH